MLSGTAVIGFFCLYMGLLFGLALWTQHRSRVGQSPTDNAFVYSLSLAVYCSSWTYYGSVGQAATHGLLFLAIYLGPTLVMVLWGTMVQRMIRIKSEYRITSVADFISTRYEKSESLAALVTVIALVGITPYVALQIKSVLSTFAVITSPQGGDSDWIRTHVAAIVVGLMILFTIIFGVRRLDPTERHEGIVMAVAAESLVKLVALMAVGLFTVFSFFDGPSGFLARLAEAPPDLRQTIDQGPRSVALSTWLSYLLLSANAIICLPRQFHVAVVENQRPDHVRRAMWLFPLYLFLINLFIYPIALAGLLGGIPPDQADTYVLQLPMRAGHQVLALMVFLGGFSAATSMVLISSMTLATMISNHLLLPLADRIPQMAFIQRRLLPCRWLAVTGFILLGYGFERLVGESFRLVDIGLISFAAMLQLAPSLLGGLFWAGGNKRGAKWGLLAGFGVWFYTLLLPALLRSAWPWPGFLDHGPWGVEWLRPEHLFGLTGLEPVAHTVFWSLVVNGGLYVLGSLRGEPSQEGQSQAEAFVRTMAAGSIFHPARPRKSNIPLKDKQRRIHELFTRYFGPGKASALAERCIEEAGLARLRVVSISQLAELYHQVEKTLAGSIGSAAAHRALARALMYSPREAEDLREMYAEILADLRASPEDLKRQIDFHLEREILIERHASELEEKVRELENQIALRLEAEGRLRESEERYRLAIENSSDGVVMIRDVVLVWSNPRMAEILGYPRRQDLIGLPLTSIVHPDDRERVVTISRNRQAGRPAPSRYDFKGLKKDQTPIYVAVSATTIQYGGQTVNMAYLRDVTQRRLAEEEIRNLSRRLIVGIEEERRRLAADLHDEFGQALTGLHLSVEALGQGLDPNQHGPQIARDRIALMIEQLAESLRTICGELRPDALDHLGLVPTVESFLNDFKDRVPGLQIQFDAVGFVNRRVDAQPAIAIYRILQEAMNNVVKHAQATRVSVQMTYSYPDLIMVITDDGQGFLPDGGVPAATRGRTGIGLVSMKERAAAAGGAIEIRSGLGKGATIRVTLPAV